MENKNELMCAYAALLLADSEVEVTADNLNSCISAAGGSVPGYYTALFEKVNGMTSFADLVENAGNVGGGGGGGGAAPAAAAKGGAAAAAPVEEEEEEEELAPAADLFGGGDDY